MSGPLRLDIRHWVEADLQPVVDHVRRGGVLAYPTETVYGLGARCTSEGVRAVKRLKGRADDKPLLVLVGSAEEVEGLAWSPEARELARVFWPGALTLVLRDPEGLFPPELKGATGGVGVRVSPHPFVAALLAKMREPLTSTSLNMPGESPSSSGDEARKVLDRLPPGDVLLVDAGVLPPSGPSTVVDFTGDVVRVQREGTIPVKRLRCVMPEIQ